MINLFGITITAPDIVSGSYYDYMLVNAANIDSERKILGCFLQGNSLMGQSRIVEITVKAEEKAKSAGDLLTHKSQAQSFYLEQLKQNYLPNGQTAYEDMVLQVISAGNFPSAYTARQLHLGKRVSKLPVSFPRDHKKAESVVVGTVFESVGSDECRDFLVRKIVRQQIQELAKEMFFAVNQGLNVEQIDKYLTLIYELNKLKTADATNLKGIKKNIINSILTNSAVELVHIKCLRFAYPEGRRLQLIDHVYEDQLYRGHRGYSRRPQDETPIFSRLQQLSSIFELSGIKANLSIFLSDQDLIDYFPDNNSEGLFPEDDLITAQTSLLRYLDAVTIAAPYAHVAFLRFHLSDSGRLRTFDSLRLSKIRELTTGNSPIPEAFIESKVDYRYQSNAKIFNPPPSRQFARSRVIAQVASLQALSVLGQEVILIEEDHGNDNNFIGGYKNSALPVFFTDLKSAT